MKKPFQQWMRILILLSFVITFIGGCKKDDDGDSPAPITPTGATLKTTVTGRITDVNGAPVNGVAVELAGNTKISDSRGFFLFVNVNVSKSRFVMNASKSGFFDCVRAKRTQSGAVNYVNFVMQALPAVVNVSGTIGGVVNLAGGASITFPINAFVDPNGNAYTGQVKVYARHLSPGADNFEAIIPGGDLLGKNTAGEDQSLYSLGMIEAKLFDNTGLNEIKLATGKTATLSFPIHPSQNSAALSTIPMWYLNETTGIWQEEGQATKTGNNYIGNVSHFTTWNCDYSGERCDIEGKVVDCQNNPIANAVVTVNGFFSVTTNNTGYYTTWVPVGYVISCQVLQVNNPFIIADSPVQSITAVAGQVNVIPALVTPCATRMAGTIKQCGGVLPSPAFVYSSWPGGSNFYYSDNGTYEMNVEPNISLSVLAFQGTKSGSISVNSGAAGSLTTAPAIEMCIVTSPGTNTFTINDNAGGTAVYTLSNITSATYIGDSLGNGEQIVNIHIDGIANPGNFQTSIHMNLYNNVDGTYSVLQNGGNYVSIYMNGTWNYISGMPISTTDNKVIISDYGLPGGLITGTYSYDTPTGSITSGSFSVVRTQ